MAAMACSRTYPDSGEAFEAPFTSRCGRHAFVPKSHGPRAEQVVDGLIPPPHAPTSSAASLVCALLVYKRPVARPSRIPGFRKVVAKSSVRARPPPRLRRAANVVKVAIVTEQQCLFPRPIATAAGCAAIHFNGGVVRAPRRESGTALHCCASAPTSTPETIASRRTMQLSRRRLGTMWM